jgi:hypothetical protein
MQTVFSQLRCVMRMASCVVALSVLLAGWSVAHAVPLSYAFDIGIGGTGSFTITPGADAPAVTYGTAGPPNELTAFSWTIPGVGIFDINDLAGFSLSPWDPLVGLQDPTELIVVLSANAVGDTGTVCATCGFLSLLNSPNGGAQIEIDAPGSPCADFAPGPCGSLTGTLTAVPEPSTLSLIALALLGAAMVRRISHRRTNSRSVVYARSAPNQG